MIREAQEAASADIEAQESSALIRDAQEAASASSEAHESASMISDAQVTAAADSEAQEFFFFSHSIRALSWVLVSQAGGKRAKRRVPFFSAALWAFAVRPLLGCLNGFASVLFVSPIRAMLRWPNPLEAARETHCAMH